MENNNGPIESSHKKIYEHVLDAFFLQLSLSFYDPILKVLAM